MKDLYTLHLHGIMKYLTETCTQMLTNPVVTTNIKFQMYRLPWILLLELDNVFWCRISNNVSILTLVLITKTDKYFTCSGDPLSNQVEDPLSHVTHQRQCIIFLCVINWTTKAVSSTALKCVTFPVDHTHTEILIATILELLFAWYHITTT